LKHPPDITSGSIFLSPALVSTALDAASRYGKSLPAATGKVATVGFCWGGGQSFSYATVRSELNAAVAHDRRVSQEVP